MRLRHIVPTLGLVATAISAQAVEAAPGLTIGGFVDATLEFVTNPGYNGDADANIDFQAEAELRVGYAVSEKVQLQIDYEVYDNGDDAIEQAYVAWGVADNVTLMMGKWEGLIGYEAWDAPDLFRINTSPVFDLNGVCPVGLDVNFKANENLSVDVYLVDGVYVQDQVNSDMLGVGASLTYKAETFLLDLDIAIDPEGTGAGDDAEAILGVNLSGEYTGMEKLTVFGDFAYRDFDAGSLFGIMAGGNYQFSDKMSATLMVSFLSYDEEIEDPAFPEMEVALALLTMPTGDQNFGLNFELEYNSAVDMDDDEVGFYVEMLAVIP